VPETQSAQNAPQATQITTLSNGMRVASLETFGEASSVALTVAAGSKYESSAKGVSQLVGQIAFKATESRSHLRLVRDLEDLGASWSAESGRENITYSLDCLRSNVNGALSILAESVTSPHLSSWQLAEQKSPLAAQVGNYSTQPQAVLTEALHAAAFGDSSAMGSSQYPSSDALAALTIDDVAAFRADTFTTPRMVLAASGVDHKSLVAAAESLFGGLPTGAGVAAPADSYVGGETRIAATSGNTYVALGLSAPGAASKDFAALYVLQALLDARLAGAASSFASVYQNSSLFGAYAAVASEDVAGAVSSMTGALKGAASGAAQGDELARAIARVKATVLGQLESRSFAAEYSATTLQSSQAVPTAAALAAGFDAVTAADVQRVAAASVAAGPALASVGDISAVPSVAQVAAQLK
jgi:processing peptidase subunit alpha